MQYTSRNEPGGGGPGAFGMILGDLKNVNPYNKGYFKYKITKDRKSW